MHLRIEGAFPGMNEIVNADRAHWAIGAKLKKQSTQRILEQLPEAQISTPARFKFHLVTSTRKDPDNLSAGFNKAFFDAIQLKGWIPNDSIKEISSIYYDFEKSDTDYVEVDIEPYIHIQEEKKVI